MLRCIAFVLLLLLGPFVARAQEGYAVLEGTVVDAKTGQPLPGAHVFLATTMLGTATDDAGRFRLEEVPPGAHRLFASMLGFKHATRDTLLRPNTVYAFDLRLEPTVIEIGELEVSAERDPKWKKRLRAFERLFLGETDNADQVTLVNPEVLDFEGGWGRLSAWASAPLIIENRALGYRLQYFLTEFIRTGTTVKYDGEPLFEEMEPEDEEQAALWTENRRRAYAGSFRHLMLSLLDGTTREEGFMTYSRFSLDNLSPSKRFPSPPDRLLEDGPTPTEKRLRFSGFLEVEYTDEQEAQAYLRWSGRSPWSSKGPQRSWMRLTSGPTLVDHTGEVLDPYGVTVYGYFAFERIADLLPKEYRPEVLAEETGSH